MKLAIFSDSHDNLKNIRTAIRQVKEMHITTIIHCGDLVSPFVLDEFKDFDGELHFILGNNPGDIKLILEKCEKNSKKFFFHGHFGNLKLFDRNIAIVHEPHLVYPLLGKNDFDIILYGHTHVWDFQIANDKILLNPGEILGKNGEATWAVLDLNTNQAEKIIIE